MRLISYILLTLLCLTACQSEDELPAHMAELCLTLEQAGRPAVSTRAVSPNLAVTIKNSEGTEVKHYEAGGTVDDKIVLDEGTYTIVAYSDNQTNWQEANGGKGVSCYYAETSVTLKADEINYVTMQVPLTNYAVTLTLPDTFDTLFTSYTFTLTSGSRTCEIKQGEKAYFSVADGGFTYAFKATNNDGVEHSASAIPMPDVEAGKLYNMKYSYASASNSGGIDIEIKDDMEPENGDIEL